MVNALFIVFQNYKLLHNNKNTDTKEDEGRAILKLQKKTNSRLSWSSRAQEQLNTDLETSLNSKKVVAYNSRFGKETMGCCCCSDVND